MISGLGIVKLLRQVTPNCTMLLSAVGSQQDDVAARLAALITDQERLLEIIRKEKTEWVHVGRSISAESLTRTTQI
jgi:hypothetical protein